MLTEEHTRRHTLVALAGLAPAAYLLSSSHARGQADGGDFMMASRLITGAQDLSAEIGGRIEAILSGRASDFPDRLRALAAALRQGSGPRDARLGALGAREVETALVIARPWYLGFVGHPADFSLKDDAVFATYLQAQSFSKLLDVVPRPTYPGADAGWWAAAPAGVEPPPMPAEIVSWTFQAPGPAEIRPPDPAWKAYALAAHPSLEDARRAKPQGSPA